MEWRMVDSGLLRPADVLKVAHHGSRTSTTVEFLGAVQPVFAVISNGSQNSYRFPHREVLSRLDAVGARVIRTDESGLVQFRTNGRRIEVEAWINAPERNGGLTRQPAF